MVSRASSLSDKHRAPLPGASGLPKQTLLPILRAIREGVADIRGVFATPEIRMVGSSLFIIYEPDWVRAEDDLQRLWLDEDDEEDEEDEGEDHDDEDRPGPPFVVKIIAFAHTCMAPMKVFCLALILFLDYWMRGLHKSKVEVGLTRFPGGFASSLALSHGPLVVGLLAGPGKRRLHGLFACRSLGRLCLGHLQAFRIPSRCYGQHFDTMLLRRRVAIQRKS